jgi:hypothetical protein
MANQGQAEVRKSFTIEAMVDGNIEVYQKIINGQ